MSLFQEAKNEQGFLKANLFGFGGSGKSYTSSLIARGLAKMSKENPLPVYAVDSEKGFDYLVDKFKTDAVVLKTVRTRSFADLLPAFDEAEKDGAVLIIDSVTHFWKELIDSYQRETRRPQLRLQDWAPIKSIWAKFTDRFLNARCHTILCGRAGDDYDYQENEDTGKMEVYKAGTKMMAEKSLGYEPGLVVEMEKVAAGQFVRGKRNLISRAHVLKDRFDELDGRSYDEPTFETFLPHIAKLNLGVQGAMSEANSGKLFQKDSKENFYEKQRRVEIVLEEIQGDLLSAFPGQSAEEKKAKTDLVFFSFNTRSWEALKDRTAEQLKEGRAMILARIAEIRAGMVATEVVTNGKKPAAPAGAK